MADLSSMLVLGYNRETGRSHSDHLSTSLSLPDVVEHLRGHGLDPDIVWMIVVSIDGNPWVYNTSHKDKDFD